MKLLLKIIKYFICLLAFDVTSENHKYVNVLLNYWTINVFADLTFIDLVDPFIQNFFNNEECYQNKLSLLPRRKCEILNRSHLWFFFPMS